MRALVTGAGGFLGAALVRALLQRGYRINTLQRGTYKHLAHADITNFTADIADSNGVDAAAEDCDIVFHVAARAGVWGRYGEYYRSNVKGTMNVISACQRHGIDRLVYTSSPSVVFDGEDEEGLDESAPYSANMMTHYQRTKAEAEQRVMKAGTAQLATVSLRPHLMWGPGDTQLVPRIIERAKTGRLRLVADHSKLVDATYIDNAVSAHLLAADAVYPGAACSGKTYFIGNGEPLPMAELVNGILGAVGMKPVEKTISPGLLYAIGTVAETVYRLLAINREPFMTRFIARQLSCAHWYNLDAARRDLGYQPLVSVSQGLQKLSGALNE